ELEVRRNESGMVAVDERDEDDLHASRSPEERRKHDAAVEPGARVAREERVGQRRQDEAVRLGKHRAERAAAQRVHVDALDLGDEQTADEYGREALRGELSQVRL